MRVPIDALDAATDRTGWDDHSRLAVTLDFIQSLGADTMRQFDAYVAQRADEEFDNHAAE